MSATTFIYALKEGGIVRYIGKADNPAKRFKQHLRNAAKGRTYKDRWIQSMLTRNEPVVLDVLMRIPVAEWDWWERAYISIFGLVFPLTNSTEGGDGVSGKVVSDSNRTRTWSTKSRNKISIGNRGKKRSPEARVRYRAIKKSPAQLAALALGSAANRGRQKLPDGSWVYPKDFLGL